MWAKSKDLLTRTMDTHIPTISAKAGKYCYPLAKKKKKKKN